MKRELLILIFLLAASQYSSAQITFQKTYGGISLDWGQAVQQTTDAGYVITGITTGITGWDSLYLIKTHYNGDLMWTKKFGGTYNNDGNSVQQTTDGGYIIAGSTNSFATDDYYDFDLIKTNSNGDTLWTKTFGSADDDYGWSVQQTTDSGYIITGFTEGFVSGSNKLLLIKTDINGNPIWTKIFGTNHYGWSVKQTADSGFIIGGFSYGSGGSGSRVYLIKTDANGDSLWSKAYGAIGNSDDRGLSIQQTSDGGYIITGFTNTLGAGNYDVYLIKTDSNGNLLWSKTFGGTGDDEGWSGQQTTDGGYIITGYTNSFGAGNYDVYLIKTDSSGNLVWSKTFGGANEDKGFSVQETVDEGYIIVGHTSSFGAGDADVYLIKTDSNGNSGCNEANTATIVTTPVTQEFNVQEIVSSPTVVLTTSETAVGSGGITTNLCFNVGIDEIVANNFLIVSPSPSAGNFIISFEGTISNGNVEILNILGENVFTKNISNESKKEINLKNISGGIYFVKVFDGEKYYGKKIIIERD